MTHKMITADIKINGKQIHYSRFPSENKPSLVLVHGFTDNGLCWLPVAEELKRDFDIIMPDMHGHGLSSRYVQGTEVDMAADLAELIHALDLQNPAVCGHSMGAMVSFQLGYRFPSIPKALVLEDPPWQMKSIEPRHIEDDHEEHPIVAWAKSLADISYEDILEESIQTNPEWPVELQKQMCLAKKQLDQNIIDTLDAHLSLSFTAWMEHVPEIKCPLLLITGDPQEGAFVSAEISQKVKELNELVSVNYIESTGHLIRFTKPKTFIDQLITFFHSVYNDV